MCMYSVALRDTTLPVILRIEAEVSFAQELERVLGGEEVVAIVFRAWKLAEETQIVDLQPETIQRAMRWPAAILAAERNVLGKFSSIGSAHFEVTLAGQAGRAPWP